MILVTLMCGFWAAEPAAPTNVIHVEKSFIFGKVDFPQCHASTIAETPAGMVAAWFGGTREGAKDVSIYVSRKFNSAWSAPELVADGVIDGSTRWPCWNPVLFQHADGRLILFYKVGPTPKNWWGMVKTSTDHGATWSEATRLPDGILGPIKNKPIALADGSLLCPSSDEADGWVVFIERATADLKQWTTSKPVNDAAQFAAIQPSLLQHGGQKLQILCRSRQGVVTQAWSEDNGQTWGPMTATTLPNPNSGTDAVTLADGRHLLVYNPVKRGRTPLAVAISDSGINWKDIHTLEREPGEYSYPAVIQASDGKIHITYTWKRERVAHAVLAFE